MLSTISYGARMYEDVMIVVALFVLFWVAMVWLSRRYDLEKRGLAVVPGQIMWRTRRGLSLIEWLSRPMRFWRAYGDFATIVGVIFMFFMPFSLIYSLYVLLTTPTVAVPGVQFVLPGLVPGLSWGAWIIAIGTVLLVHEGAHGVLTRALGMKIKSVGAMLLLVIPGAFVEPDEKQLTKSPVRHRLRVYSVGAFSNMVFGILILGLILLLLVPKPGVYVNTVLKGSPADNHNVVPGMRLFSVNGTPINSPDDFTRIMGMTLPGDNIRVVTEAGENVVTLVKSPYNADQGFFGISLYSTISRWNFVNPLFDIGVAMSSFFGNDIFLLYFDSLIPWVVIDILKWIFVLNIGIGLFNLVPAVPLDGGYMLRGLLEKVTSKKNAATLSLVVAVIILGLIIANILPGILRLFGLV